MKLTASMFQELNAIRVRYQVLLLEAYSNVPDSFNRVEALHHEELNAYKVKLENFVIETDVKEQLNSYSTKSLNCLFSPLSRPNKVVFCSTCFISKNYYHIANQLIGTDM